MPVFSMGALIRKAYREKDEKIIKAYEKYSMKGRHLPISLKFDLLKKEMDKKGKDFILDNFPASKEDLDTLEAYLRERNLFIHIVFYLNISENEMKKRYVLRGRKDDDFEVVKKRREIQDKDRIPVIEYFKKMGILFEIYGEKSIKDVQKEILSQLNASK